MVSSTFSSNTDDVIKETLTLIDQEDDSKNTIEKIIEKLSLARMLANKAKPIVILMKTEMGNGVDFMMHTHAWHGKAPNDEQLDLALSQNPETLGDY